MAKEEANFTRLVSALKDLLLWEFSLSLFLSRSAEKNRNSQHYKTASGGRQEKSFAGRNQRVELRVTNDSPPLLMMNVCRFNPRQNQTFLLFFATEINLLSKERSWIFQSTEINSRPIHPLSLTTLLLLSSVSRMLLRVRIQFKCKSLFGEISSNKKVKYRSMVRWRKSFDEAKSMRVSAWFILKKAKYPWKIFAHTASRRGKH